MTPPEVERYAYGVPTLLDAGTPSPLPGDRIDDALETLEFGAVINLVAAHAAGPLGAARVRDRRPVDDMAWIEAELATVGEVLALIRGGDALVVTPAPEASRVLGRLRIDGSVLEPAELLAVRRIIAAARANVAELARVAELAPRAALLRVPLPDRKIERRLEESVDDDAQLLDTASPRLAAARREVHAARQRLVRRLEALIRTLDPQTTPQDATVTVRNGRYVIPVRRDSRSRPGGIVHDESGSHGTLFVEPAEAIELGNALREAEVNEERETLRVLRELTDLLRPDHALLGEALEMCARFDDLVARARYAVAVGGERPGVRAAPGPFEIRNGRHPLLRRADVVPFDLVLDPAVRTVLISGPNTGGKTVLLKAAALASALAQSGIIPPVGERSVVPVFGSFFADIGDRQSIAASLSTFSAHVALLRRILLEADERSLVLLDEIGSGTDPVEGAALAEATLRSLTRRRTMTLATTHLGSLKNLASREPGIVNASLQFDTTTLTPTYRFTQGIPGRSYGLAIARRLGIPAGVLADAESAVPDAERRLDSLLARVEQREQELATRLAEARVREVDLDGLDARLTRQRREQDARDAELGRRERAAERAARDQARAFLLEARQRVDQALAAARVAVDEAQAREARRLVEEGIAAEREAIEGLEAAERRNGGTAERGDARPSTTKWSVGDRVRVPSGAVGRILELRGGGKFAVALGSVKMTFTTDELQPAGAKQVPDTPPDRSAVPSFSRPAAMEIDLRGLTGDEAEVATVAALDAAVLAENPFLRIIHGMGTGVVRDRVRRIVGSDRRVRSFDFAPRNQGGTGVTVVEFAP